MQLNALGFRRKLLREDTLRRFQQNFAAAPRRDAPQNQHVRIIVIIGVMRRGVAEIDANRLKNFRRVRIAAIRHVLRDFQAFRQEHLRRERDARRRSKLIDGLLREIQRADAPVARPFVRDGRRIRIHRRKGEFVQIARDAACRVQIADRLARSHRHAENAGRFQRHRARQRRHVAVVNHDKRHAPFFLQIQKHRLNHRLKLVFWHGAEQRGDFRLIRHENSGGTPANRVHAGHLRRR